MALEAFGNIVCAVAIMSFPTQTLQMLGIAHPSTLARQLIQLYAGIWSALVPPLILALPNRTGIVYLRRMAYYTMLGAECPLLALTVGYACGRFGLSEPAKVDDTEYVRGIPLLIFAVLEVAMVVWRVLCLFLKPDWMGVEVYSAKKDE